LMPVVQIQNWSWETTVFKEYRKEAEFALHAVRIAARLCRRIQSEMIAPSLTKLDRSPVTVADFASQAVVASMLARAFPEDSLVAEEDSRALRSPDQVQTLEAVTTYVSSLYPDVTADMVCGWIDRGTGLPEGRFWVLDPIDGTKGFLRGDQYVVALALVEGDRVMLGALGCPNLNQDLEPEIGGPGSAVIAVRGQGAWATGLEGNAFTGITVSRQAEAAQARLLRSFESGHTDSHKVDQLVTVLGIQCPPILMDSQAKYAVLAGGGGELLFRLLSPSKPEYVEWIWDQAAGSIIVEEAGGRVSDLRGRPLDFSRGRRLTKNVGVLVSNGRLHEKALQALRAVGANRRPGVG
jgi:3'(2'), 5'-bisphosphate nucleotidase